MLWWLLSRRAAPASAAPVRYTAVSKVPWYVDNRQCRQGWMQDSCARRRGRLVCLHPSAGLWDCCGVLPHHPSLQSKSQQLPGCCGGHHAAPWHMHCVCSRGHRVRHIHTGGPSPIVPNLADPVRPPPPSIPPYTPYNVTGAPKHYATSTTRLHSMTSTACLRGMGTNSSQNERRTSVKPHG